MPNEIPHVVTDENVVRALAAIKAAEAENAEYDERSRELGRAAVIGLAVLVAALVAGHRGLVLHTGSVVALIACVFCLIGAGIIASGVRNDTAPTRTPLGAMFDRLGESAEDAAERHWKSTEHLTNAGARKKLDETTAQGEAKRDRVQFATLLLMLAVALAAYVTVTSAR